MMDAHPLFPTLTEMREALQVSFDNCSGCTAKFISIPFHDVQDNHMVSSTSRFCLPQRVVEVLVAAGDINLRYLSGRELFNEEDAGAQRSCEQIAQTLCG